VRAARRCVSSIRRPKAAYRLEPLPPRPTSSPFGRRGRISRAQLLAELEREPLSFSSSALCGRSCRIHLPRGLVGGPQNSPISSRWRRFTRNSGSPAARGAARQLSRVDAKEKALTPWLHPADMNRRARNCSTHWRPKWPAPSTRGAGAEWSAAWLRPPETHRRRGRCRRSPRAPAAPDALRHHLASSASCSATRDRSPSKKASRSALDRAMRGWRRSANAERCLGWPALAARSPGAACAAVRAALVPYDAHPDLVHERAPTPAHRHRVFPDLRGSGVVRGRRREPSRAHACTCFLPTAGASPLRRRRRFTRALVEYPVLHQVPYDLALASRSSRSPRAGSTLHATTRSRTQRVRFGRAHPRSRRTAASAIVTLHAPNHAGGMIEPDRSPVSISRATP